MPHDNPPSGETAEQHAERLIKEQQTREEQTIKRALTLVFMSRQNTYRSYRRKRYKKY